MSRRRNLSLSLAGLIVLALIVLASSILFTVNERELVVVLQFGDPVAAYDEPGLKWKVPFIQEVRRLPKTLQFWAGTGPSVLIDLPTADGKKVEVTPWAIWRITDPERFVEVLRTVDNAELRVATFVRSEMRDVITANDLVEVVRSTNRSLSYTFQVEEPLVPTDEVPTDGEEPPVAGIPAVQQPGADTTVQVGRKEVVDEIKRTVQARLRESKGDAEEGRGVELVDVGIARIDFVPTVREAAFQRLIAFMESIASRYTNEGQRRKQEILNQTDAEVQKILGEGKREANELRGNVEAEIIENYAAAIQEAGEFYNFIRTLDVYKAAIGSQTRLVLTTDSDLFRLLKTVPPPPEPTARERSPNPEPRPAAEMSEEPKPSPESSK